MDFALYLGNVGGIGLDLLRCAGSGKERYGELVATSEQLRAALLRMSERSDELYSLSGRRIEIRELEQAKKRLLKGGCDNYCYASCGRSLVVLPDGEVYPCGSLLDVKYRISDFDSIRPLASAKSASCNSCRYNRCCPGGCPSRMIRNESSLDCVLLKASFEIAERKMNEAVD